MRIEQIEYTKNANSFFVLLDKIAENITELEVLNYYFLFIAMHLYNMILFYGILNAIFFAPQETIKLRFIQ